MGKQRRGSRPAAPAVPWVPRGDASAYIGIDIGGVLVDRAAHDTDTSFFGGRPMETPAVHGAVEAVARLVAAADGRVCIVSKAGPRIEALSRQWLALQGIADVMIPWGQIHFVRERADKGPVCERLKVTHFVDDNVGVLNHLTTVRRKILFTGGLGPNPLPTQVPKGVTVAATWPDVVRHILDDIGRDPK